MMPDGSLFLRTAFVVLPLMVATAFVLGVWWAGRRSGESPDRVRRQTALAAAGTLAWLTLSFGLAAAGWLTFDTVPPTMMVLVVSVFALGFWLSLSRLGERLSIGLPLAALVAIQGFRFPLELAMHRAYEEGLMPVQMSYSGYNFDILTGVLALVIAALLIAGLAPIWLVWVWNSIGAALLVTVVTIAILSTPMPIRMFHTGPPNVWITGAPYVWLPTVLVLAAFVGHILVFRRLLHAPEARQVAR